MSTSLSTIGGTAVAHLDESKLQQLAEWVSFHASPEQLAWESDKFRDMRKLLKEHKAAKHLRVAAVRLECIALRRIALAGFASKLTNHYDRRAAEFFGEMTDEEFAEVLDDSEKTTTPFAVYKHYKGERDEPARWVYERSSDGGYPEDRVHEMVAHERHHFAYATQQVLSDLAMGEAPFTVAEAAHKLLTHIESNMGDHEKEIPPEMAGEPLREVVRRVLRAPGPSELVYVDGNEVRIPGYVTFHPGDGDTWQRVPWVKATLGQLLNMVATREEQAHQMQRAAGNLRRLYESLAEASDGDPAERVNDITAKADLRVVRQEAVA